MHVLDQQKILAMFFLFITSLFFSVAIIDQNVMYLKITIAATSFLSFYFATKKSSFSALFAIFFSIFFVIPFLVLEDDFLRSGTFYVFTLSEGNVLSMLVYLYLFLFFFTLLILLARGIPIYHRLSKDFCTFNKYYYLLLLITGIYMVVFNVREALYVWDQGYVALVQGAGDFKKHILEFFVEMVFLCSVIFGLRLRNRAAIMMLILYCISGMLGGQRMPGFMMLVVLFISVRPKSFRGLSETFYIVVVFCVAVPLLHVIAALRMGGFELLSSIDIWHSYEDVFYVIGFSFDTLKAVFFYEGQFEVSVTPFAKLFQVSSVFMDRVFDIPIVFDKAGFAGEFARNFNPFAYESKGVTFASSGIAESYFFFGYFGAPVYALIVFICCRGFDWCLLRNSFISLAVLFVFAPKFFVGVRNELFGWLWEGGIIFIVLVSVYFACKPFFRLTTVHNRQS